MNPVVWIPLAVAIAFALLRWLVPAKAPRAPLILTDADRAAFQKWEFASVLPLFLFGGALIGVWYLIMKGLAALFLPSGQAAEFLIVPSNAYWLLPAIFLGIVSSAIPTHLLYRRLLGSRYAAYNQYTLDRVGFDGWAVLRVVAVLAVLGAALALVCGVNSATIFTKQGIEVGRPFSLSRSHYNYSQVTRVLHRSSFVAPNGSTVFRPHYVIEFSDGTSWSTRTGLRDPEPRMDVELAQFVANQSNRAVENLR